MKTDAAATRCKFNNLGTGVTCATFRFNVFGKSGHRFPLGMGIAFLTLLSSPVHMCSASKDQVDINSLVQVVSDERLTLDYIPSVQKRTY